MVWRELAESYIGWNELTFMFSIVCGMIDSLIVGVAFSADKSIDQAIQSNDTYQNKTKWILFCLIGIDFRARVGFIENPRYLFFCVLI